MLRMKEELVTLLEKMDFVISAQMARVYLEMARTGPTVRCVQKDGPALAAFAHSVASVCCQITPSQYSRRSGMVFPIRGSQFHQHALSVWPARNTCTVLLALSAFGAVQVKL